MKESPDREAAIEYLVNHTRSIPDYPKKGIIFRDLTTLFQDDKAFNLALDLLAYYLTEPDSGERIFDKIVGIESRGFILAGGLAGRLGGGVVLARKPGKLPYQKRRIDYSLEYGMDALEMHVDAIEKGENIVILDDLLATGGTADAACKLVEGMGGVITKVLFLVELPDLHGREKLAGFDVDAVFGFEGE